MIITRFLLPVCLLFASQAVVTHARKRSSVRGVEKSGSEHGDDISSQRRLKMMSGKSKGGSGFGLGIIRDRTEDDDRWSDDELSDRTVGGGNAGSVAERYECKPADQMVGQQFFLNPDETGETGSLRTYDYTPAMCTCNSGCCRIYNWLICDEDDSLPYIQCICNQNTALPSHADQQIISIEDPNNTGGTVTVISNVDRTTGNGGDAFISTVGSTGGGTFQVVSTTSGGTDRTTDMSPTFDIGIGDSIDTSWDVSNLLPNNFYQDSYGADDCLGGSMYQSILGASGYYTTCNDATACGGDGSSTCCWGLLCICLPPGDHPERCLQ